MKIILGLLWNYLNRIQMARRTRKTRKTQKGRGYGFGGSILSDAGGSNAGNPLWNNTMGSDCGMSAQEMNRGGNNTLSGGRRKRRGLKKRKTRKGGAASTLALQQPRAGYTFTGEGVAGTADPVPSPAYTTYV